MKLISTELLAHVAGGDAAVTRPPGTNSWGEKLPEFVDSACIHIEIGPLNKSWCINSNGTKTETLCVGVNTGVKGVGGGGGSICSSVTTQLGASNSPFGRPLPSDGGPPWMDRMERNDSWGRDSF
jgi:hypothetical protein